MDYNWLLTTIAQSSAALVGISSGFLILRINMFINERRTVIAEFEYIRDELQKLRNEYDKWHYFVNDSHLKSAKLKKEFDLLNLKVGKKKFPYSMLIGIIGVVWLIYFSIIYPVWLIPQIGLNNHYTWKYFNTIPYLKVTFLIGLIMLAFYLICEIRVYMKARKPKMKLSNEILDLIEKCNREINHRNKK